VAKTSYAKKQTVKVIRKKMNDLIQKEASTQNLTDFVRYMLTEAPAEAITKAC